MGTRGWLVPWVAAREVFEDVNGGDDVVNRLQWARSIVGFGMVVYVSWSYRSFGDLLDEALDNTLFTLVVALGVLAVVGPLTYLAADVDTRRSMRLGVPEFLRCLFVAALAGVVGWFLLTQSPARGAGVLANLLLVAALLWFGAFVVVGSVLAARSVFRVSEVHPMLTPVCAACVAAVLFVVTLFRFDTRGVPTDSYVQIVVGGFVSTVVIAAFEFRLLWRDGYRLPVPWA